MTADQIITITVAVLSGGALTALIGYFGVRNTNKAKKAQDAALNQLAADNQRLEEKKLDVSVFESAQKTLLQTIDVLKGEVDDERGQNRDKAVLIAQLQAKAQEQDDIISRLKTEIGELQYRVTHLEETLRANGIEV